MKVVNFRERDEVLGEGRSESEVENWYKVVLEKQEVGCGDKVKYNEKKSVLLIRTMMVKVDKRE